MPAADQRAAACRRGSVRRRRASCVRSLIAVRWMNVNASCSLHAALVDQHALGAVDDLARLELLAERVDLAGQVAAARGTGRSRPRSPGSGRSSGTA